MFLMPGIFMVVLIKLRSLAYGMKVRDQRLFQGSIGFMNQWSSTRLWVVYNLGVSGKVHTHSRKWVPTRRHVTKTKPGILNLSRTFHVQNSDWLYLRYLSTIHKPLSTLLIRLIKFQFTEMEKVSFMSANFSERSYCIYLFDLLAFLNFASGSFIDDSGENSNLLLFVKDEHAMRLTSSLWSAIKFSWFRQTFWRPGQLCAEIIPKRKTSVLFHCWYS